MSEVLLIILLYVLCNYNRWVIALHSLDYRPICTRLKPATHTFSHTFMHL